MLGRGDPAFLLWRDPMHASGACLSLIKRSELCKLTAYWDDKGQCWTIGWGHTGADVREGLKTTQVMADWLLRQDVKKAELAVEELLKGHPTTQGQYDALIDFVYNLGAGRLAGSTLLRKFLAGDVAGAAAEFPKWDHEKVNGQEIENQALLERRKAEQRFFLGSAA